jgi:hypothetical protein
MIYALSGFIALGLEIVWFRFFGVLQKSTSFTFGNLLGIYLTGLAIGILAGVPLARRARHPYGCFSFCKRLSASTPDRIRIIRLENGSERRARAALELPTRLRADQPGKLALRPGHI